MGNICFGRHSTIILKPFDDKKPNQRRHSGADSPRTSTSQSPTDHVHPPQQSNDSPRAPIIIAKDPVPPVIVTEVTSHRDKEPANHVPQPVEPSPPAPAAPPSLSPEVQEVCEVMLDKSVKLNPSDNLLLTFITAGS